MAILLVNMCIASFVEYIPDQKNMFLMDMAAAHLHVLVLVLVRVLLVAASKQVGVSQLVYLHVCSQIRIRHCDI